MKDDRIIRNRKEKAIQEKYQIRKRQDMMEYMASGSRNSPPFMTD